ncbi:MAG: SDR family oxidoreductase [Capnocytophaga sp.]|nr:SDR family oxidoreductase [Capnocytophaga sp.]
MKNIIITGSSRGIGYELVKKLAQEGHNILALSRNTHTLANISNKNLSFLPFDITKKEDFEKLTLFVKEKWQNKVDILINNAGKLINKPFEELSLQDFQQVYEVNIFGVAKIIQTLLPFYTENAHIVNISSMGGVQGSLKFAGLAAYSSSKGALITLTELLAEEYREKNWAFNVLALGAVQTEMLQEAFPDYKAKITAEQMANYIAHFALTGNQFFNGKLIPVANSTP